jgi:hypothetical protein
VPNRTERIKIAECSAVSQIGEEQNAPQETVQKFEWVPYRDASARKRARAHITRGFRREKALHAQAKKEKKHSDSEINRSLEQKSNSPAKASLEMIFRESDTDLSIPFAPGSGVVDPFASLAITMNPEMQFLFDYCKFYLA